jgi:hypothetical protein
MVCTADGDPVLNHACDTKQRNANAKPQGYTIFAVRCVDIADVTKQEHQS